MIEFNAETQCVVSSCLSGFINMILKIVNIVAASFPSLIFLHRVHERPHAILVLTVLISEIVNVKYVRSAPGGVGHAEVVPLGVFIRVGIWINIEIIFLLSDSKSREQVAALESAFKNKGVVTILAQRVRLQLGIAPVQLYATLVMLLFLAAGMESVFFVIGLEVLLIHQIALMLELS